MTDKILSSGEASATREKQILINSSSSASRLPAMHGIANDPDVSSPLTKLCIMCVRLAKLTCQTCNAVSYCSEDCKRLDRPAHVVLCKKFKNFAVPPKEHLRRGIYLSPRNENPRFVWLPTFIHPIAGFEVVNDNGLLGPDGSEVANKDTWTIRCNPIQNRNLEDTIVILCREDFADPSVTKQPHETITKLTRGHMSTNWKPPAVVFRESGLKPSKYVKHMDPASFRHLLDYLSCQWRQYTIHGPFGENGMTVLGVRINCEGDKAKSLGQYVPVRVPANRQVFQLPSSSISNLLGFPLQIDRYVPDPAWKYGGTQERRTINPHATYLHMDVNAYEADVDKAHSEAKNLPMAARSGFVIGSEGPTHKSPLGVENGDNNAIRWYWDQGEADIVRGIADGWGYPAGDFMSEVGSVVVVRADGIPLLPQHVEALCNFIRTIEPLFAQSREKDENGEPKLTREAVLNEITRSKYESFFEEQCQKMGWKVLSPYKMTSTSFLPPVRGTKVLTAKDVIQRDYKGFVPVPFALE